jgi:hypothetical protein
MQDSDLLYLSHGVDNFGKFCLCADNVKLKHDVKNK